MPTFSFTARDSAGQWHNGTQAAESIGALAGELRARRWSLVKAEPAKEAVTAAASRGWGILPATSLDVEFGLLMLANMLKGGLTLMASLKTCADQARRPRMARIWDDVHDKIAGGMPFADALAVHRRMFPQLVIQLARAGEISGNLEIVLDQAANQLERKRNLIVTLVSAMMYPTFAITVAIGVTAYLMVKVIPEIAGFLANSNKKLPAMTVALMGTSNFIKTNIMQISIITTSIVVGLILLHKWKPAALVMDKIVLKIPIVGRLFRLAGTTMFARGLAMLLDAGVPMIAALDTAGGLIKNQAISTRVDIARQSVLAGNTLAKPLGAGREFLPMLPRMVAVGEETGTLSIVLNHVAEFHEKQLESYVKRMTLLIEPVMTVVVGGIVGFVYLAFFMAIYSTV